MHFQYIAAFVLSCEHPFILSKKANLSSKPKPFMLDKRQSYRFRLPWRSRSSQVEPEPRPTAKSQNPGQKTTTVPIERPPFRPAGIAPVKASTSQSQPPPRTEPPPQSPSRAANESHNTSTSETQIQVESFSPSPSGVASQHQAAPEEAPQTQSQPSTQELPSFPAETASPASQPEPQEAILSQAPQTEPEPKAEIITSETISNAQSNASRETAVQTHAPLAQPAETNASSQKVDSDVQSNAPRETSVQAHAPLAKAVETVASPEEVDSDVQSNAPRETTVQAHAPLAQPAETISSPEKVDPDTSAGDHSHLPESDTEMKRDKGGEKIEQVPGKEEETKELDHKEAMQEKMAQPRAAETDLGKHAKHLLGHASQSQAEEPHKKQEAFYRRDTSASTSSSGKQIKTPKDSSTEMSIQKMVSPTREQASPHEEITEDVLKLDELVTRNQMLANAVSVITLSGENRGSSMQVSSEPAEKDDYVHIHRSYQTNPDDSPEATTTDGEGSNNLKDQMSEEDQQTRAYINSNVQSINNAIVFNSSVTERNPGVQAVFSQNPPQSKSENVQTHKVLFTKTSSEKLTHEPSVRRRCLGGLFLEPSDSESDNPEKPRRHGCRYNCVQKGKG